MMMMMLTMMMTMMMMMMVMMMMMMMMMTMMTMTMMTATTTTTLTTINDTPPPPPPPLHLLWFSSILKLISLFLFSIQFRVALLIIFWISVDFDPTYRRTAASQNNESKGMNE
jgi:ABC-type cobalt transport system substrate-binding protein